MRLEISPLAEFDLEAIGDYIAQDSTVNAVRFVEGLRAQCEKITRSPMAYVARLELADGLRSCSHGRYIIFFRIAIDVVHIVRILHIAMDANSANFS